MLKGINSLKLLAVENALLPELPKELTVEKLPAEKLKQLAAEINLAVAAVNYMELITVNAKGRSLKFMTAQSDGNVIDNLLLSITSATEGNLLLFLDGKIAMEDVNKFITAEND
jgi:inorganic pyrophosphatase/exopolyphosphatase